MVMFWDTSAVIPPLAEAGRQECHVPARIAEAGLSDVRCHAYLTPTERLFR